ncbi:phosphohydrolase [Massilia sp. IC2-477]|uniref:phosphohydrolase n=1 Tax=Massilia sp. IC2-477 TaxID=2887198 RepID=UPI001D124369|nr:phosphohydrolase [Massilia sp. IC2-477]MCC2958495.1 phosphohydrolase [Massilia sp. IC2-477]
MHNTASADALANTRAWVRMPSGKRLDLLNPTPFDWDDADLALGLARTYRWGGHSAWPLPLSVAQHSIAVMLLRRAMAPASTPVQELRELLHDAEEGLLGFDAISVIKPFLGEGFRALTQRLEHMVFLRYGLPAWTEKEHRLHKQADRLAAASEAVHVTGWTRDEVRRTLKIRADVLDQDPLAAHYGCTPWEPWPPGVAAERFLAELERLKREAGHGA